MVRQDDIEPDYSSPYKMTEYSEHLYELIGQAEFKMASWQAEKIKLIDLQTDLLHHNARLIEEARQLVDQLQATPSDSLFETIQDRFRKADRLRVVARYSSIELAWITNRIHLEAIKKDIWQKRRSDVQEIIVKLLRGI